MKTVKVTKYHIDNGIRGNAECCAIALALNGEGYSQVFVDDPWIEFADDDRALKPTRYRASDSLKEWITNFDNHEDVGGITIEFKNGEAAIA